MNRKLESLNQLSDVAIHMNILIFVFVLFSVWWGIRGHERNKVMISYGKKAHTLN